ncbi:Hypothetical predicted protein [Paramuricea clavata]|uniref:Uncharacterized protein n=1 Tax=Paramuricea clavata TaxID=317549 RepID=A0A6S7GUV6_PARCT|nr:Hypothetical predicted protein [Paramuricea clavata]
MWLASDFREKKEKALQTISELVHLEKTRENREIRESLQRELEKQMEFFAEKIWLLSLARKASEKRVTKLLALIERLKDENHQLQEERDKALQKIGNLSLGSEDMEIRMEELASELQSSMENSKHLEKRCNELQDKLKKAESELDCIKLEKETLSSSLEHADGELASKYSQLERKHKELEQEYGVALAKVSKMERELERTSMDLAVEKKRSISLQESLSLSVSKHEQELQDILETIPTEACDNSHSSSKSSAITGYQVRSKLRAFLANKCLKLFKSVSLAFRTDKDSLPQRLEYQERARDAAENDIVKTLNVFSNGIKTLEQNFAAQSTEKNFKDLLSSLYHQIGVLNECSRRVSSQSHQYGSYQQEARMMSGVDVLISHGESLSRRLETLAEKISAKELQERINRSKECCEDTQTKGESSSLSRRGSSFYNFVSSMRANDSFRLFSSAPAPVVAKTSPELEALNTAELDTEIASECGVQKKEDPIVLTRTKQFAKQRSCLGRCLCCSIKFIAFLVFLAIFLYVLIQYSVFDRYFIMNKFHDYLKSQRFGIIYYDHEPAV